VIVDFIKEYLRPSAPLAVILPFVLGVAWLWWRPSSRGARRYLLAVVLGYWLATTPILPGLLVASLSRELRQVQTRDEALGADVVVVLGGGASTYRAGGVVLGRLTTPSIMSALEGARVSKAIRARLVIASGGEPWPEIHLRPESEMLRDALIQAGVPAGDIIQESSSRTTRDQARLVEPLLRANGVRRFVLVTSPMHMRRAIAMFRREGLDPVPSPALIRSEHVERPPLLLPNWESFSLFDDAVYEYGAWVYYWWNGWMLKPDR